MSQTNMVTRLVEVIDWPDFAGGAAFAGLGGFLADFAAGAPFLGFALVIFAAVAIGKATEGRGA